MFVRMEEPATRVAAPTHAAVLQVTLGIDVKPVGNSTFISEALNNVLCSCHVLLLITSFSIKILMSVSQILVAMEAHVLMG